MSAESVSSGRLTHEIGTFSQLSHEAELIRQAKTDPEAFGQLYETHYDAILSYIYRHTLDLAVAEELTSNTFFKVLQALPMYRHRAPFRAWLYRIATNEVRMRWRKEKKRRAKEHDPCWEHELQRVYFAARDVETEEEREEKMRAYARVHECLKKVPERYQTVLVLRYFEQLSYNEISKVVGKRVGTVKSLVHRGVTRLRALMQDENATFSQRPHYHG